MNDIQKRHRLPRPATVLAVIAVFVALVGTATAAGLINGKQIKKGTITGKQIKNKSIGFAKLNNAAVGKLTGQTGAKGAKGERGAKGEKGDKGATGAQGPAGIVTPLFGDDESENIADGEEKTVLTVPVPTAGTFVINAKTIVTAVQAVAKAECTINAGGNQVDLAQLFPGTANARGTLALQGVATATPGSPLKMICSFDDGNGSVSTTKLTAIPVG